MSGLPGLRVKVARAWDETPEIRCFELIPLGGGLPDFHPGAHIDVMPAEGIIRQYSLWNGPLQNESYFIGVKREPESRGGSVAMHDLAEGAEFTISAPKNNFDLVDTDGPALLLAGGIGVTPLLSMAQHLQGDDGMADLHIFARNAEFTPFQDQITAMGGQAHHGLLPPELNRTLGGLLAAQPVNAHLYMCGPGPFMDLVVQIATALGWADDHIHLEHFSVDTDDLDLSGGAFEVVLQQSGLTFAVGPEQTIIAAMEEAGHIPLTSCEQGVCGTCITKVLEGEPDHRDQYLSDAEKAAGTAIMPCVSRCKGNRLVLDI